MLIRKENLLQKKRRNKMTYKKPELLIPASSLEVLKTAVIFGDCGPRQKISAVKKWRKELHSPMHME